MLIGISLSICTVFLLYMIFFVMVHMTYFSNWKGSCVLINTCIWKIRRKFACWHDEIFVLKVIYTLREGLIVFFCIVRFCMIFFWFNSNYHILFIWFRFPPWRLFLSWFLSVALFLPNTTSRLWSKYWFMEVSELWFSALSTVPILGSLGSYFFGHNHILKGM